MVLPLHGLSAGATRPVAGLPVPPVSTWPSWASCTPSVSARRTAAAAVGWPAFSLNHSSPSGAYTDCAYRPAHPLGVRAGDLAEVGLPGQ